MSDAFRGAVKALEQLNSAGFEAFLVGGCVRDRVLGRTPKDWDIATAAKPEEVRKVFSNHTLHDTGLKHGTWTLMMEGLPLEITTYRLESTYSDGRHPDSLQFTGNLRADLSRRDFTINAMAWHPELGLVDPFGGQKDAKDGILRCVGEPELRFREDGLRILRALRFAGQLDFSVEEKTDQTLRREKEGLKTLSAERARQELTQILCSHVGERVLREYEEVVSVVLPEIHPMVGFAQQNTHHHLDVWNHTLEVLRHIPQEPVLRWAALLHDVGKPLCYSLDDQGQGHFYGHSKHSFALASDILNRLKFDHGSRDRILLLIRYHDGPIEANEKSVIRGLNRFGEEAFRQLIQLFRADLAGQSPKCQHRIVQLDQLEYWINEVIDAGKCFSLKDLAVTGRDLISLGYQGPEIGRILETMLGQVMAGEKPNQKEALLNPWERTGNSH